MFHSMIQSMFYLHLPVLEKIVRPILVYVCLIGFLRLFGKRELAQLNPFDLVVLLSLSNTVQNAIIGDDNSVTGGMIGAFSLLAINWIVVRLLFRAPKLSEQLEGDPSVLIRDGQIDHAVMKKETLTETDLLSVLHKQGVDDVSQVRMCVLEPNGTFYVEPVKPSQDEIQTKAIQGALEALTMEVQQLRAQLANR
jgi:uncharacterized membrane protein YcaP (DUF421 family)